MMPEGEDEEESAAVDALVEAAKHGRVEKVKRALRDSGGAAKDWRKANGFTPLVRADIIGHARIIYVGKSQSCMVESGRLIPHASYLSPAYVSRADISECRVIAWLIAFG